MPYRVLIVESDECLRKSLLVSFARSGFDIAEAINYSQALYRVYESNIDLVVMESLMSDGNGFEVCHEFRNNFGIPVILLGQESGDQVWERVMTANADHYEIKPYKYVSLIARAQAILRRYKPVAGDTN